MGNSCKYIEQSSKIFNALEKNNNQNTTYANYTCDTLLQGAL